MSATPFPEGFERTRSPFARNMLYLGLIGLAVCFTLLGLKVYREWLRFEFARHSTGSRWLLWQALSSYAIDHNGCFPAGRGTPDACLCLLYPTYANADLLRGPKISASYAQSILDSGDPWLGYGRWEYVPGLTANDDPRLALAWEKEPSGPDGARTVVSVGNVVLDAIPASEWPAFLAEQQRLLSQRDELAKTGLPLLTAKLRLPSGEVVDRYNGGYSISHVFKPLRQAADDRSNAVNITITGGSGSYSGVSLTPQSLRFYRNDNLLQQEGYYTLTLSVGNMWSKPVEVEYRRNGCTPKSILFEMQNTVP